MSNVQFMNNEETNTEAEDEEDVTGVIMESKDKCNQTQTLVKSDETDTVAEMGVIVDSDGESCEERAEDSARCHSCNTEGNVNVNPDFSIEHSGRMSKLIEE